MNQRLVPLCDWPGYFASDDGAIVSMRSGKPVRLKLWEHRGYLKVTLHRGSGKRKFSRPVPVHRLIAVAFVGEPECDDLQVRHLNGNATDNRASNLAWGTAKENYDDAVRHGTQGAGMRAPHRRLTAEQVEQIRQRLAAGERDRDLAIEYGVSRYYPSSIARGKRWAALGHRTPGA
jgi:hypothetical protein